MKRAILAAVLAIVFASPATADRVYAGTCGKLDLYDDADLDFRVFVALPNDPAQSDLSAPGSYVQHLRDGCLAVLTMQIHETDEGQWDCGVFLAAKIPDCSPDSAALEWLDAARQRATKPRRPKD